MGKPVPSLSTNYLPTKTVQHLLNEITKITRFIAVSSEAPCCVVFWRFQSALGKRDSRLACQWSVPLSVCFPSENEEQLERRNLRRRNTIVYQLIPVLKRVDSNTT